MAGEAELTGLAKQFNSVTHTGRANVAKVSANRPSIISSGSRSDLVPNTVQIYELVRYRYLMS
jgi:hypothetical protein